MGCDIHPTLEWLEYPAVPEYPNRLADHWTPLSYEPMSWGRDYTLFARMAGVRCRCTDHEYGVECPKAVAQPRGFPPDCHHANEYSDCHTPSWLALSELKQAAGDNSMADVYATIAAMEEFERRGYRTRLVFAFDN